MSLFDNWKPDGQAARPAQSVLDRWATRGGVDGAVDSEDDSILDRVLDVVAIPGRMTAGVARALVRGENPAERAAANLRGSAEDDFDDVLADVGVADSFGRRALGFVGDVVLDPLNVVPIAPLAKAAGAATGVGRALNAGAEAARTSRLGQALAKRLVPFHGTQKFKTLVEETLPSGEMVSQELSYKDLRRLQQSRREYAVERANRTVLETFPDVTREEASEIALALDEGTNFVDPRLDAMRLSAKRLLDDQFAREADAGTIDAAKKRDHYITHLVKRGAEEPSTEARAISGRNPFQQRKELSLRDGVQAGVFEGDVRTILGDRLGRGAKAVEDAKFISSTFKHFGRKMDAKSAAAAGYRRPMLAINGPLQNGLKGVYLPQEIARDLEKMVELPTQGDAISQLASSATALWKGYATRANLGYHARNGVGNMLQAWFAGVGDTGTKVLDPLLLAAKHAKASMLLWQPERIGQIGRYSGDDIRRAINEYGVLGGHHTSFNELDDVVSGQVKSAGKSRLSAVNPLNRNNLLLRSGARVGNAVEGTSRLAIFFDQLEKGETLEKAALHVRKYLYDYSEITDDVRKVRDRFVPFATWYVKNLPQQIDNVLRQPDKASALARAFEAVDDATEDSGAAVDPSGVPDWMRDHIQLPMKSDQGAALFLRPNLPIEDLNKLEPSLENAERNWLSAINPLLRVPAELATNRQFFMGTQVYDPDLGPVADYRRANPMVSALADVAPHVAETAFGAVRTDRGTEMPAVADYLLRQLPPVTQYGKPLQAITRDEAEDTGEVLGVDLDMLPYAGLSVRPLTDVEAQRQEMVTAAARARKAKAVARENRRLRKADVKALYERYLKN